jgi:hypothetical protein
MWTMAVRFVIMSKVISFHVVLLFLILMLSLKDSLGATRPRKVSLSSEIEVEIQEKVSKFNEMTQSWHLKTREGISIVDEVEEAFDALSVSINLMEEVQQSILTNPRPMELASLVLTYAELPVHYYAGYRLLRNTLEVMEVSPGTKKAMQLKDLCEHGGQQSMMRRATCHDTYALLCAFSYLSGKKKATSQCVQEFNFLHSSQMPPTVAWSKPHYITRQVPGLSHIAWWNPDKVQWTEALFKPIWKHFDKIKHEVLSSIHTTTKNSDNDDNNDDNEPHSDIWEKESLQEYGTNADWDSTHAYDQIIFYHKEQWNYKACRRFRVLCSVLRDKTNDKLRNGFQELMGNRKDEIWHKSMWNSGFRAYPPLGISLHRGLVVVV